MDTASLIAEIKSRPAHDVRCERILVAIDGSHASFHAATWAIELGRRTGAELTVLMVVDYDAHVSAFEQVSTSGYLPAELLDELGRLLGANLGQMVSRVPVDEQIEDDPGDEATDHPGNEGDTGGGRRRGGQDSRSEDGGEHGDHPLNSHSPPREGVMFA